MKRLYILRHAKSSWDDQNLSDFERPLNDRGEQTAPAMGRLITRRGLAPGIIVSSPAVRARTTAELVKQGGSINADIKFDDRVYEASPQALLYVVSELDDRYDSAMIVGHNPGMEGFIRLLSGKEESMPTAALAVIDLKIGTWALIEPGSGKLKTVVRPKDELKTKEKGT
jgi:phosphohistidine phosphatase